MECWKIYVVWVFQQWFRNIPLQKPYILCLNGHCKSSGRGVAFFKFETRQKLVETRQDSKQSEPNIIRVDIPDNESVVPSVTQSKLSDINFLFRRVEVILTAILFTHPWKDIKLRYYASILALGFISQFLLILHAHKK